MARKGKTKTILIIEDEADIRIFAARVLELEGYHVIQTESGDEGLRLVREIRPALVLLDLRLLEGDGWVVLEQLKSEPELAPIPVVVFTASAAVSQQSRALATGASAYIVKPLSAASLRQTVARILRRKGKR